MIAYTSIKITFQCFFINKEYISTDPLNPDLILVGINENIFYDPIKETYIDTSTGLVKELPPQIDPEFAQKFEQGVEKANEAATSILVINIIV